MIRRAAAGCPLADDPPRDAGLMQNGHLQRRTELSSISQEEGPPVSTERDTMDHDRDHGAGVGRVWVVGVPRRPPARLGRVSRFLYRDLGRGSRS